MRPVALVEQFFERLGVAAGGALDGRLHLVLGHVDALRVLDGAPELGVHVGVWPAGLHRDHDLLADPRELFRHAVIAREHGVFALFEHAAHCVRGRWEEGRATRKCRADG